MSRPVWPEEDLRSPRLSSRGFSAGFPDAALGTKPERGRQKVRLLTSAPIRSMSASVEVDRTGAARLERFFIEETRYGTLPFFIRDPVYDGAPLATDDGAPIVTEDGVPIVISAWLIAQFVPGDPPRLGDNRGPEFVLSFPLNILP